LEQAERRLQSISGDRAPLESPQTARLLAPPLNSQGRPLLETTLERTVDGTSGGHMQRVPRIVPVTDLRQDAAAVLKRLQSSREPLVITQRGRAAAVLVSLEAYERSRQEREILRQLARGEQEISRGKGHSLESVLREVEDLLSDGT
jgi:prevent-host-death family protein